MEQTTTVNALRIQRYLHKQHIEVLQYDFLFSVHGSGKVLINLMNCFFKKSASKIRKRSVLKSRDKENMTQAIKAVCNKDIGYLAAAKNITCLVLNYTITFAQVGVLFKPPSQNWGVRQLFLQPLKRSFLDISY